MSCCLDPQSLARAVPVDHCSAFCCAELSVTVDVSTKPDHLADTVRETSANLHVPGKVARSLSPEDKARMLHVGHFEWLQKALRG